YAINVNAVSGYPQIAGSDTTMGHGVIFEYDGSAWPSTDLNDSAHGVISSCSHSLFPTVTEAHDINDNSWIVAYVLDADNDKHVALLTPVGCLYDVDGDGDVDDDDAAAVAVMVDSAYWNCP